MHSNDRRVRIYSGTQESLRDLVEIIHDAQELEKTLQVISASKMVTNSTGSRVSPLTVAVLFEILQNRSCESETYQGISEVVSEEVNKKTFVPVRDLPQSFHDNCGYKGIRLSQLVARKGVKHKSLGVPYLISNYYNSENAKLIVYSGEEFIRDLGQMYAHANLRRIREDPRITGAKNMARKLNLQFSGVLVAMLYEVCTGYVFDLENSPEVYHPILREIKDGSLVPVEEAMKNKKFHDYCRKKGIDYSELAIKYETGVELAIPQAIIERFNMHDTKLPSQKQS